MTLNECHLFAGCGGGILGGILLGHRPAVAVEINPYCRKVLAQRQADGLLPAFPIFDDVRTFDGRPWRGKCEVVCGGFPCQDISSAGKGAGLDGERSGLWAEMRRVIGEIQPRFAFVENSPMLTVRGLGRVLGDLAEMGFDAEWGVLGACDAGAPHERERIWILADADKSERAALVERERALPELLDESEASRIWPPESGICRVADGMAHRLDRLAAAGNGQVPSVVRKAWNTLRRGRGV